MPRPAGGYQEVTTTTHVATHNAYNTGSSNISNNIGVDEAPPLPPAIHHQNLQAHPHSHPHQQQVPQQAASCATKELDELMASLSEFKVRVSVRVGRWLVSVCVCLEVCVCVCVCE